MLDFLKARTLFHLPVIIQQIRNATFGLFGTEPPANADYRQQYNEPHEYVHPKAGGPEAFSVFSLPKSVYFVIFCFIMYAVWKYGIVRRFFNWCVHMWLRLMAYLVNKVAWALAYWLVPWLPITMYIVKWLRRLDWFVRVVYPKMPVQLGGGRRVSDLGGIRDFIGEFLNLPSDHSGANIVQNQAANVPRAAPQVPQGPATPVRYETRARSRPSAPPPAETRSKATPSAPSLYPSLYDTADDRLSCVVCQDAERSVLIMPCRHLCMCRSCADELYHDRWTKNCPICGQTIQSMTDVYL